MVGVVVWRVPWLPEEASTQAGPIDTLYNVLAVISGFVFALVVSILIVAVVHFRGARRDDCATGSRFTATPGWRSSGPRSRPS